MFPSIPGLPTNSVGIGWQTGYTRSEEHTSELQSLRHLVCRLLLEKKKKHFGGHKRWHLTVLQRDPCSGLRTRLAMLDGHEGTNYRHATAQGAFICTVAHNVSVMRR